MLALTAFISFLCVPLVHATAQSNQTSPVGSNLSVIFYASPEQPFLNIFKTGGGWFGDTTGGVHYNQVDGVFNLDANGYPTSMNGIGPAAGQTFKYINAGFLMALGSAGYHSGTYVFLYDGGGGTESIQFGFDATSQSSTSGGRIIVSVTAGFNGVRLTINNLGTPGNTVRNMRFVYSPNSSVGPYYTSGSRPAYVGDNEWALFNGEVFNPDFISSIASYKTLRFMDWMVTNSNTMTDWSQMITPTYVWWAIVPAEVQVALCNKIGADGWFNMPTLSTDAFVTQFATVVHNGSTDTSGRVWSGLNSNLKAYVEYGNELWNTPPTFSQLETLGMAAFPKYDTVWGAGFYYGILRAVQNGATWKSVWGADAGRVVRILAGQSAWSYRNQFMMKFTADMYGGDPSKFAGTAAANVDAFAVAPYFGYAVPDTFTLDQLFTEMMSGGLVSGGYPGGMIKQALDWMAQNYADNQSYGNGIPLLAYEGGQSLVDYTHSDTALQSLYAAANRDPRMGTAYTTYFNGWKKAGGTLFNHYTDIGQYSTWGFWGALENVLQTSSPKYDALKNFISNNPCWWNGCSTTSSTPTSSPTPTADTTPPSVPTGVTAAAVSSTQTNISWTASTDNVGVTGYKIFRNGAQVGTASNASYQDTGLSAGTAYTYTVSAYDAAGNTSAQSSGVSVTTPAPAPVPAPSVAINSPTNGSVLNGSANITVSANSANGIKSITITADGTPFAACTNVASCSATWQKKKMSQGTHTIGGIATDTKGLSAKASVTIVTR